MQAPRARWFEPGSLQQSVSLNRCSGRPVALRYLKLHAIVRTQLGGPPTVAGFKVLVLRLQPRAETVRPEGVRRPHGIVYQELPFRDGLGQALQIGHPL